MSKKRKIGKTKVGVFGIAKYVDREMINKKMAKVDIFKGEKVADSVEVITYDSDGVAALIRDYCSDNKIKCTVLKTRWDLSKDAGVKRNTEILTKAARVIIFTDNKDSYMKTVTEDAKAKKRPTNTFCVTPSDNQYYKVVAERPATESIVDQRL